MPGFVPGIHVLLAAIKDVDGRDKPGHDERQARVSTNMTIALPAAAARRSAKIDLTWPVLIVFAAVLCVLIVLPMSWLFYYSFVDRSGAFTLDNFRRLVTD